MSLLLVIPVSNVDYDLALQSMAWMKELGTKADVLLVKDAKLGYEQLAPPYHAACELMDNSVTSISALHYGADDRWPIGPNWMFLAAARYVEEYLKRPWLWCEADAVPLREGWLEELDAEYASCGKPFMGALCKGAMSGVGCYPSDTASRLESLKLETATEPWDMAGRHIIHPQAAETKLIQNLWGEPGLSPQFVQARSKGCERNVLTLDQISRQAVLFHRDKTGTLIGLLRQRRPVPA